MRINDFYWTRIAIACVLVVLFVGQCGYYGYKDIPEIKQTSGAALEENGFEIIGYQGYQFAWPHGGFVWYTLKKGDITYHAAISKWFGEYHIYNLSAVDAIKP